GTFSDCTSLVNMEIPEGVVSIGSAAFRGCSALQSIVLPESLNTVESNSFYGCGQLQSIYVPKGTKGKFIKLLDLSLHSKLIE
ncbi:MAG: leucine-rich repeat domain-containing protein, partial [Bacteroidales bacterium]